MRSKWRDQDLGSGSGLLQSRFGELRAEHRSLTELSGVLLVYAYSVTGRGRANEISVDRFGRNIARGRESQGGSTVGKARPSVRCANSVRSVGRRLRVEYSTWLDFHVLATQD